ncbi:MAG: hypothetical protein R3C16_07090 [Hyphomonadaceae bacterium]
MPITIRENGALKLHAVTLSGRVMFDDLRHLGMVHLLHPAWAGADTFHIVEDDADLDDLTEAKVDAMRAPYRQIQSTLDLYIVRRAAWVCYNARAYGFAEHWLKDRHSRDGQQSEVILIGSLDEADDLFSSEEIEAVRAMDGFVELARIDARAAQPVVLSANDKG